VMRPRSSSRERNTSASVTVTVTVTWWWKALYIGVKDAHTVEVAWRLTTTKFGKKFMPFGGKRGVSQALLHSVALQDGINNITIETY